MCVCVCVHVHVHVHVHTSLPLSQTVIAELPLASKTKYTSRRSNSVPSVLAATVRSIKRKSNGRCTLFRGVAIGGRAQSKGVRHRYLTTI